MKLPPHALSLRSVAASGLLAAVLAAGIGIATTSPEAVVSRSFASALEETTAEIKEPRSIATISGTEEFWLSEKRRLAGQGSIEPAAWAPLPMLQLAVGDRITIGSGATARSLEVVSVAETTDADDRRSLTISARDSSNPAGPLITFVTSIQEDLKDGVKAAHAL